MPEIESVLQERGLPPGSILLAHAYERVMPGPQYLDSIVNYWRVYAGAHSARRPTPASVSSRRW